MLPANLESLLHFALPVIENVTVSSHVIHTKHIKSGYIYEKKKMSKWFHFELILSLNHCHWLFASQGNQTWLEESHKSPVQTSRPPPDTDSLVLWFAFICCYHRPKSWSTSILVLFSQLGERNCHLRTLTSSGLAGLLHALTRDWAANLNRLLFGAEESD